MEFSIPAALVGPASVTGTPSAIPALLPMDLLEDDGITDIHGGITTYSYRSTAINTPEPSTLVPLCFAAALMGVRLLIKKEKRA